MTFEIKTSTSNATAIDKKTYVNLYQDMYLGRLFEDNCAKLYYKGKMFGFIHLYNGQEAISTGIISSLRSDDFVASTYRDHVHAISKGVPSWRAMAELFGKETGCCKGRGGSMHMFSSNYNVLGGFAFIGEGIPVATGAAFQISYRKQVLNSKNSDQVVICFFGDGTSNNGQFFECLNMAALWKLPVIFVIENNQWAIGMAHHRSASVPEIYKKAESFGLPGVEVDGMDVLKVREAGLKAVERARKGNGPTLIEALTYRFRGHSLADPDELRSLTEKKAWIQRDPIIKLEETLLNNKILSDNQLKSIQNSLKKIVNHSVKFSEDSPDPKVEDLFKYLFA